MDFNREALETRLLCFGRAVQNGRTFHTFQTQRNSQTILQMYLKNIARTARKQPDGRHLLVEITIHCTHYLSSHWLRAYSKFILEIGASYRLVSYLLADN